MTEQHDPTAPGAPPPNGGSAGDGAIPPSNGPGSNNSGTIQPVNLEEEMRSSFLDYAMSVIISRALPDVRDGLKPVHRRVLFAMSEASNFYNRPYKKAARMVGDIMGKYH